MVTPEQYFMQLRLIIVTLDIIQEFEVRDEIISEDDGYMRLRLNLVNGDIAEMFEYVVRENDRLKTINYSFHLQNAKRNNGDAHNYLKEGTGERTCSGLHFGAA